MGVQVQAEGDVLTGCAVSTSGEALAFGGSGGYVHLWAASPEPSVNHYSQVRATPLNIFPIKCDLNPAVCFLYDAARCL